MQRHRSYLYNPLWTFLYCNTKPYLCESLCEEGKKSLFWTNFKANKPRWIDQWIFKALELVLFQSTFIVGLPWGPSEWIWKVSQHVKELTFFGHATNRGYRTNRASWEDSSSFVREFKDWVWWNNNATPYLNVFGITLSPERSQH
jgi:hypothetical protein